MTLTDIEAILGKGNVFALDDSDDIIDIATMGDYMTRYEPIEDGEDAISDIYIPIEEWKAEIDQLWRTYQAGKTLLEQAFPEWTVSIGEEFNEGIKGTVTIPSGFTMKKQN